MENILHSYSLPYNPLRPLVVFDERPCFLISDVLTPIPMEAGQPKREHYEYEKNGSCTVFLACEPLTGKRWVRVYEQRTGKEYAEFMQYVARQFKDAEKIVIVQDNLATHSANSFYKHLPKSKAFELMQRFDMQYTPAKSSWLNMAEIELSVLSRQCLSRRIGSMAELEREVRAWVKERNVACVKVVWQFGIGNAREKFARHYPKSIN